MEGVENYWLSVKLVRYSKRVFNHQGTVNYDLNFSHFRHSTTGARRHVGMLPKTFRDESVHLARSFYRALLHKAR